jgi:O-antigen biosynthesis protein
LSDEGKELKRRIERLAALQREMDARLWTIENSRAFRILQRIGVVSNSIKTRLRRRLAGGLEAAEKQRAYRSWLAQAQNEGDIAKLSYQPRFEVVEGSAPKADADYFIFLGAGGRLRPNALFNLAEAVQQECYEVLYGDEDHGSAPLLKPGWSPELLGSPAYLGQFLAVRKDALEGAGEFRDLVDLARRLAERKARFQRVPRVLVRFEKGGFESPAEVPAQARQTRGNPLASIVICSRDAKLLKSCLQGIARGTAYSNHEVVVVEHEMEDPPAGLAYTRVRYSGRFDFAAMNNLGAKAAKGEVLVFLNDDVRPLSSDWLEALVGQAQRPEVGVAGALLLYPDGSVQHAGIALGINGYTGHPGRGTFDGGFWPWTFVTRNVSAVTGACLAIRREVFEELGGFDPKFPVNYNDIDLCLRAGNAGYQVLLEAAARLKHFESRTRKRGIAWEERELFAERWGEQIEQGDPYYHPSLTLTSEDCSLG